MSLDPNVEGALPSSPASAAGLRDYVVAHLDEAIERGWIGVYYQPVIRTLTGKICGFEALARWDDPVHGFLAPNMFIEALEDAQLIHKLDLCCARLVCSQHRAQLDTGFETVPISFNLSRLDFELCDIYERIEEIAAEYRVPRRLLNVEITESTFGGDPAAMARVVNRFRGSGYGVWMDDFGSGYSTLNVLKDYEFDELKIDMEFLKSFGDRSKTIIASIVDMAKKLGIKTLAEGVETEEHRKFLTQIGCEKLQGYLYSKPVAYSDELASEFGAEYEYETAAERAYIEAIEQVNTLSLSERDFSPNNLDLDYLTSMPLAIVEFDGAEFSFIGANPPFRESLESIGVGGIDEATRLLNIPTRVLARSARKLMKTLSEDIYAREDYVYGSHLCVMRAKYIASYGGKTAMVATIDTTQTLSERRRTDRQGEALQVMYSIYDHVDIVHLDEGWVEPVFSHANFRQFYDAPSIPQTVKLFAENEIAAEDRARYLEFMDVDTLVERIDASGELYLIDFFRCRDEHGTFSWKLFAAIRQRDVEENRVMICIRSTHWANDDLLHDAFAGARER